MAFDIDDIQSYFFLLIFFDFIHYLFEKVLLMNEKPYICIYINFLYYGTSSIGQFGRADIRNDIG